MHWKDLGVRSKIIICFTFPIILMAVISAWTFSSSKAVYNKASHLKNESMVYTGIAQQMGKDVIQIQQWLTDISATRGLDGLDDGFVEAEKSYSSFLSGLAGFEEMYEREGYMTGIKKTGELRLLIRNYYETGLKMAKAYVSGGPEAGNKMMAGFDEAAIELSASLKPFLDEQVKEASTMATSVMDSVTSLRKGVFSIFVFSIVIAGFISILLTRNITSPLNKTMGLANSLAKGDLTDDTDLEQKDEFGCMMVSMRKMLSNFLKIVGQITGVSGTIASSSEELSATTNQITAGINEQTQQLEQSAAAITEVSQTITEVARSATGASDAAKESAGAATEGKSVVEHTVKSMMNIAGNIEDSSRTIGELGESSQKIGDIINVINDIAGQTNLLALNAAIEAARAGEQGRGFAVVADEVRKLAEKTSRATEEITSMINKIQKDTGLSVASMNRNKEVADEGVNHARQAAVALDNIVSASERCLDQVRSIATATEQQSTAVEEVSSTVENISNNFGSSREAILQISASSGELARVSSEMINLVSWFKTGSSADGFKKSGKTITGDELEKSCSYPEPDFESRGPALSIQNSASDPGCKGNGNGKH